MQPQVSPKLWSPSGVEQNIVIALPSSKTLAIEKCAELWRRGEKLYMQTRVSGEKSARKIPLDSVALEAARAEMADIRKKNRGEGLPATGLRPLFADYARKYLEFQRTARDSGKKPRTIAREDHSLVHWIAAIGNVRLDKITKPMITGFVKARLEKGLKPRTVNIDVIVLRNVLKEARDDGLIVNLPTEGIKPKKVKTPVRSLLSPAAFENLCKAAGKCGKNSVQLLDYIRLLAYSGARRDEALALKWEDVSFERKFLRIGADGAAKNSKARHVDFNAQLEAHLKEMATRRAPDSQWLFPSPQRGQIDKPARTFRESFLIAREKAELEWVGVPRLAPLFREYGRDVGNRFQDHRRMVWTPGWRDVGWQGLRSSASRAQAAHGRTTDIRTGSDQTCRCQCSGG